MNMHVSLDSKWDWRMRRCPLPLPFRDYADDTRGDGFRHLRHPMIRPRFSHPSTDQRGFHVQVASCPCSVSRCDRRER